MSMKNVNINCLFRFVKEKLSSIIKTEEQYVFLCHLVGPFLQRFNNDRPQYVMEITIELYQLLEQVDKSVTHLNYMDSICDLLYPLIHVLVNLG